MIPQELEVKILHLYFAEDWPVGTIAAHLHVHHETVERVLGKAGSPRPARVHERMHEPFVDFIKQTWAKYPGLTASRLWKMCKARGYPGAKDHFRHLVAPLRPRPVQEPFLRLCTLPGEQAQVDWAHFGKVTIGRAQRPLVAFVAVLSWSRAIFVRFFFGQQGENFLRGHEAAFAQWNGTPKVILYDNLKSAVLQRIGDAIRFNPLLLEFAAHYRYEPRPVAPGRGNEKPRVERAIGYVRSDFFVARRWREIEQLNEEAARWANGDAMERPWPLDRQVKVRDAFAEEQPRLRALPANGYPTDERREVSVRKTPYVRFDLNDYSVPHEHVGRTLVVVASLSTVRIVDGNTEVARHARNFDRGQQVENPAHIEALLDYKRQGRKHRGLDRLGHAAPASRALLERLAERGANIGNATQRLLALLDAYGAEALEAAIRDALQNDVPHLHAVRQVLERQRRARGLPPALPMTLPDDPRVRELQVRPHELGTYDGLARPSSIDRENQDDGNEDHDGSAGLAR